MLEIQWNPSSRELRQFAAIWLPAFAALAGGLIGYRLGAWDTAAVIWILAGAAAVAGLVRPPVIRPVFVGLMLAAYPIGWTVSHLVLGVLFYGLFTVTGLLMRLVRYDPMSRARGDGFSTYWSVRQDRTDPGAYFRQF